MLDQFSEGHARIIGRPKCLSRTFLSPPYCKGNHNSAMLVYDPKKIVALRSEKGWNQAELARRAGLSQPSVWALERGRTQMVKFETLEAISGALGVPLAAILAVKPKGKDGENWEAQLRATYGALDDDGKATLLAIAQTLLNSKAKK